MEIKLNFRWQVDKQGIDPVLFRLLESIQQEGSLQQATKIHNVSYRFAWGLLNQWQAILGQPLVILERGRGAKLSAIGHKLLSTEQTLLARFSPELDNFATQFKREFEALLSSNDSERVTLYASHGLAMGALRELMHQQSDLKLDLHFYGSLESLRALEQKQCDIAGFHIPIGAIANTLSPHYLKLLDSKEHKLIYVVKRNQGLMVKQGNPKQISGIKSLINTDIEFINRQAGSGTRLLFDQLLQAEGIPSAEVNGYDNEEFTHMAVAAMIASGAADVGFGIAPMAEKLNLQFIPLIWEHYCLAVPSALEKESHVNQIIQLLKDDRFKEKLTDFSGYDACQSGESVSFEQIFE